MRTFLCQIDLGGLRRFIPEELMPADELRHLVRRMDRSRTTVWALLADHDAEDLRADLDAGRHAEACVRLLNRAIEYIGLTATASVTIPAT